MGEHINIYCDESCHLQNDKESVMVLGAVYCKASKKGDIFFRLAELKKKHNLIPKHIKNPRENRAYYEIKWNKVSKIIFKTTFKLFIPFLKMILLETSQIMKDYLFQHPASRLLTVNITRHFTISLTKGKTNKIESLI